MKMISRLGIFFTFLVLVHLQNGRSEILPGQSKNLDGTIVYEAVSFETNKEMYMIGDEIKITCSTYDKLLRKKIDLSKIVYIELFTSEKVVVSQIKIKLSNGSGDGYITIPKQIISGVYFLRAYTNYQKNFGCEKFSYKTIQIINPFKSIIVDTNTYINNLDVTDCLIFPEGGQIVYNNFNKIAVCFQDSSNKPVSCKFDLVVNDSIQQSFETNEFGISSLNFYAKPGNIYKIKTQLYSGELFEKNIKIEDVGAGLYMAEQSGSAISVGIKKKLKNEFPFYLCYQDQKKQILPGDSILNISLSEIKGKVFEAFLLDKEQKIISNLKYPVNNKAGFDSDIISIKQEYHSGDTVNVTLGKGIKEHQQYSLSVYHSCNEGPQKNEILDRKNYLELEMFYSACKLSLPIHEIIKDDSFYQEMLIITSNMGGKPEYSFSSNDRYYFVETECDLIDGKVVTQNGNCEGKIITHSWVDSISQLQTYKTDKAGNFYFCAEKHENRDYILTSKDSECMIQLNEEFSNEFFDVYPEKLQLTNEELKFIADEMKIIQINDIFFSTDTSREISEAIPFYIKPDKIFYIKDYIKLKSMEEFLFEVVPWVHPIKSKQDTALHINYVGTDLLIGQNPLLIIDGIPFIPAKMVMSLLCEKVEKVSIVYSKYFYQDLVFDGIIDIKTKNQDVTITADLDYIFLAKYIGAQTGVQNNCSGSNTDSREKPNFKNDVYWIPSINALEGNLIFVAPGNKGQFVARLIILNNDGSVDQVRKAFYVK